MIDIAQTRAADQNINNITFEQARIDELNIPDHSLDVVTRSEYPALAGR
nr:class I SAM-dependent methyltransferase [Acaryochloris sp. IP29b_bin.137]